MLVMTGTGMLGDFGIGKLTTPEAMEHSIDASQVTFGWVGTPLFMAPEQRDRALLRGGTVDGRADLYAFGRMLWSMLTGRRPDQRLHLRLDLHALELTILGARRDVRTRIEVRHEEARHLELRMLVDEGVAISRAAHSIR